MKWLWIGLGAVGLAAFFVFYLRSRSGEMTMAVDLDRRIVQPYIKAVADGDYPSAYELLSQGYRREVPFEKFRAAHEKRRSERGTVSSTRLVSDQVLRTLFSSRRTVRLLYQLDYSGTFDTGWVQLEEEDKDRFAIEGTYRENAAETLDFIVW